MLIDAVERGIEHIERNLGEKAQGTQVDSQDWNACLRHGTCCGKQGSISAEHNYEIQLPLPHLFPRDGPYAGRVRRSFGVNDEFIAIPAEPLREAGYDLRDLRFVRL